MQKRELEQQQAEVPPSWESLPWTPEERVAAQPEKKEGETQVVLADQDEHVVEVRQKQ